MASPFYHLHRPEKLTQEVARDLLDYNPETGEFTWKRRVSQNRKAGDRAGSYKVKKGKRVYRHVVLFGSNIREHRLAFLWMTGEIPEIVDHINRDGTDNRWCNIRGGTQSENCRNRNKRRGRKYLGVWVSKNLPEGTRRYYSMISINGKQVRIGSFYTEKEAAEAYRQASLKHYGEFSPFYQTKKGEAA